MSSIAVLWLNDRPIDRLFTSIRLFLWSNVFKKLRRARIFVFLHKEKLDELFRLVERIQTDFFDIDQNVEFLQSIPDEKRDEMKKIREKSTLNDEFLDEKVFSLKTSIENHRINDIFHFCDSQTEFRCEKFIEFWKICHPEDEHVSQVRHQRGRAKKKL